MKGPFKRSLHCLLIVLLVTYLKYLLGTTELMRTFFNKRCNILQSFATKDFQERVKFLKTATINSPPKIPSILYGNRNVCMNASQLEYVILVYSSPFNSDLRQMIRETWGSDKLFKKKESKVLFFLGYTKNNAVEEELRKEMDTYKDVIQGDFLDSYRNLTLMGLMAISFINRYCQKAKYLVKADDDLLLNGFNLNELLEQVKNNKRSVYCRRFKTNEMPVLRPPLKCLKWCIEEEDFKKHTFYPPYCSGHLYIISNDLTDELLLHSQTTNFFWLEDVYITGLLLGQVRNIKVGSFQKKLFKKTKETRYADLLYIHVGHNRSTTYEVFYYGMWRTYLMEQHLPQNKLVHKAVVSMEQEASQKVKRLLLLEKNKQNSERFDEISVK